MTNWKHDIIFSDILFSQKRVFRIPNGLIWQWLNIQLLWRNALKTPLVALGAFPTRENVVSGGS